MTIKQALEQGVSAHKEGRLQDAERLYRAVLKSQPLQPDANHNLGVIAVSANKANLALPFLKIAANANPKIEQFWLTYIEALIKERQFENAKQVIEQAKTHIIAEEKFNALKKRLTEATNVNEHSLRSQDEGSSLSNKRKNLSEQKKQNAIKGRVAGNSPSQQKFGHLLKCYQTGQFREAEKLALQITQEFPEHQFTWKILGAVLWATGKKSEALDANQTVVDLSPKDAEAHYNLGNTLQELAKFTEAEVSYKQAIVLKPDFAEAHSNLGNLLKNEGRLNEAEASYRQAITVKSNYTEAHSNLGVTLQELGKLDEAEISYRRAIASNHDYAQAHYNLGNTLQKLEKFNEAEASYTKAIALNPNYAEAHSNLGNTLKNLGKLDEAEASSRRAVTLTPNNAEAHNNLGNILQKLGRLDEAEAVIRQAISLKPDLATAHRNLGCILYELGDKNSALTSVEQAHKLDPKSKIISALVNILRARKVREDNDAVVDDKTFKDGNGLPSSKILLLERPVEAELTQYLYKTKLLDLDKERDPSFGNTKGSKYDLFENDHPTVTKFAENLKTILMETFDSDILIFDSFFSIFAAGGGTSPHNHVNEQDKEPAFSLAKQKYALVYYLSVGNQQCSDPGILKFYEPSEEILPNKGLITIFPAERYHSSIYNGNKDRVIIGVNFYTI